MAKIRAIVVLVGIVLFGAATLAGALAVIDATQGRRDRVVVGSKAFTESIILAEITAEWLEANGVPVDRRFYLGATNITFEAIRSGAIDIYPEYTGTALIAILQRPPMPDRAAVLPTLREAFASAHQLEWIVPFGFANTYALAIPEAIANKRKIRSISDLLGNTELRAGFASEFLARQDGWPGLEQKYGLHFKRPPSALETGLMYQAAAEGQLDIISAYSTDGRVETSHLRVLRDDRDFFPPYEAMLMVRSQTLGRHPRVRELLERLTGTIDEKKMRLMNSAVDSGARSVEAVAHDFLAIAELRIP